MQKLILRGVQVSVLITIQDFYFDLILKISVLCVYTTVIYMYYDIKIENRIKNISGNTFQSETQ